MSLPAKILVGVVSINLVLTAPLSAQEKPEETCGAILKLYKDGDIDKALEEARWCVESLEQIKQGAMAKHFPEEVDGWKRTALDQSKAMGIAVIEAGYEKEGQSITMNLTGGVGAGHGMGALGTLAQLGIMQAGTKLRIQKRVAVDTSKAGHAELTVNLESGAFLKFESSDLDAAALRGFAEAFPVAELDQAHGG